MYGTQLAVELVDSRNGIEHGVMDAASRKGELGRIRYEQYTPKKIPDA
jgi:hypothetical protein